jgi:NTE family protein
VTINGRRYVDGGMRSAANADLAGGHDRVIVVAPLVQGFRHIEALSSQVRGLRRDGSRVLVISPDRAARRAIGRNLLDPGRRAAAARAGLAQGDAIAGPAAEVWTAPRGAADLDRGP